MRRDDHKINASIRSYEHGLSLLATAYPFISTTERDRLIRIGIRELDGIQIICIVRRVIHFATVEIGGTVRENIPWSRKKPYLKVPPLDDFKLELLYNIGNSV
jgi:hypothetical protein